jgi:hypothetical protein
VGCPTLTSCSSTLGVGFYSHVPRAPASDAFQSQPRFGQGILTRKPANPMIPNRPRKLGWGSWVSSRQNPERKQLLPTSRHPRSWDAWRGARVLGRDQANRVSAAPHTIPLQSAVAGSCTLFEILVPVLRRGLRRIGCARNGLLQIDQRQSYSLQLLVQLRNVF